jgi:hypothetical protein
MDARHKAWNEGQQELRLALSRPEAHARAIELFLAQHGMTHAGEISGSGLVSFEDEIWEELPETAARCIPNKFEHSIVWCFWHLTRCEDITMNMLVAGTPQLLLKDGRLERMRITAGDTGNAMDADEIADFSAQIDIPALRAYRLTVGNRTREIVEGLQQGDFKRKTDPARLRWAVTERAVLASQQWLIDYWGRLTVAGLLQMPPTRHNLVHLNEALKIKRACFASLES